MQTLTVKAKRIVVIPMENDVEALVCFNFTKASQRVFEAAVGDQVEVELDDTNGIFTAWSPREVLEVDVPNEGSFGINADVLIIKLKRLPHDQS